MCAGMLDLKKAMTRITQLQEELKATREDYEEGFVVLVEKNDELIKKIGIFMGYPTLVEEDEEPKEIHPEDYVIIDDTDSDLSDDDFEDEAGTDIMESVTEEYFQQTTTSVVVFHHVNRVVRALLRQLDRLYVLLD